MQIRAEYISLIFPTLFTLISKYENICFMLIYYLFINISHILYLTLFLMRASKLPYFGLTTMDHCRREAGVSCASYSAEDSPEKFRYGTRRLANNSSRTDSGHFALGSPGRAG